jgi:hypothetical protein
VSDTAYEWGPEHFCEPDATALYNAEPQRIHNPELGYPVKLDTPPEPPTFCSTCLQWWAEPEPTGGSEHRPPQKGTRNA